eukprot:g4440.t1
MQADMKQMQDDIQNMEIVGESGAGLVKVSMTGRHDVRSVSIDPSLKEEDLEMLEDLIAAAVNDAVRKVEAVTKEKMALESAGSYRGLYFVLYGHLSPLDGIGPDELGLDDLKTLVVEESIQEIATRDEIYLIDPQGIEEWSGMVQLFRSNTRVIMHSCSEDLEVFRKFYGELPSNLFDTQIAAAYLGKGDALGYAALVALMCDIEVDKSETQSDWAQRPLTEAQLNYAAEDVRWLQGISDQLREELSEHARVQWVAEELQAITENKPLASWHPLVSGDKETVHTAGVSVLGRVFSELSVEEDDLELHIIQWH